MSCPKMEEFSAWIDLRPGSPSELHVNGKVETNGGDLVPTLSEAEPQGVNPSILLLELTIVETGQGGTDDVALRDVRFEKPAEQGQYTQVQIIFEGDSCATLDVKEAH